MNNRTVRLQNVIHFQTCQLTCIVCLEFTAHIWRFLGQRLSALTRSSSLAAAEMSCRLIGPDTEIRARRARNRVTRADASADCFRLGIGSNGRPTHRGQEEGDAEERKKERLKAADQQEPPRKASLKQRDPQDAHSSLTAAQNCREETCWRLECWQRKALVRK